MSKKKKIFTISFIVLLSFYFFVVHPYIESKYKVTDIFFSNDTNSAESINIIQKKHGKILNGDYPFYRIKITDSNYQKLIETRKVGDASSADSVTYKLSPLEKYLNLLF